jgi:D-sedoheptulose 7-phosphate isomerase
MAIDLWKSAGIRSLSFNDSSLLTCVSNDCGYENVFAKPIELFAGKNDILIAISSSGRSKNILNAAVSARSKGSSIITLTGFDPRNPLRFMGSYNFYAPSSEYGFVEIVHQYIGHCITDMITKAGQKDG